MVMSRRSLCLPAAGAFGFDHTHIGIVAVSISHTGAADTARPAADVCRRALQGTGQGTRQCTFADAGGADEEQCMRHTLTGNRSLQRCHGPLVPDKSPISVFMF